MTAATITIFSLLTFQFLLLGGVIGYIVSEQLTRQTVPYLHPEMLDEYGNVLPDEILAVRFENDYETEDTEEDDS
jgi:cell division protein FtsB|tara:strand:+ start:361 stop:585 length:225 start_codon:yes stop_codon:yes gene_type:complete